MIFFLFFFTVWGITDNVKIEVLHSQLDSNGLRCNESESHHNWNELYCIEVGVNREGVQLKSINQSFNQNAQFRSADRFLCPFYFFLF